jgi:Fe-S cluster assembly protein SufD
MNVEVRPVKTAAETALVANFAMAKRALPGAPAVAALREDAFRRFESEGLPHRRVEEWKYTDLRALMRDAKPLASVPDAAAKARAKQAMDMLAAIEARAIVFVDGAFVPELSDLTDLEAGLTIGSMAQRLAAGPALAVRLNKRLVNKELEMRVAQLYDLSVAFEAISIETADYQEAIRSFVEKRPGTFRSGKLGGP